MSRRVILRPFCLCCRFEPVSVALEPVCACYWCKLKNGQQRLGRKRRVDGALKSRNSSVETEVRGAKLRECRVHFLEAGYAARRLFLLAGGLGFEPRLTESESAVLPLNYPPIAQRYQRPRPH